MSDASEERFEERTLVTFLLDETGSMESIKDDTIGGFNAYLATLKSSATPIDFTLIKFDSRRIEKVCVAVPVGEVAALSSDTYRPGAATPLIDAAYKTIKAVEKSLNGSKPQVVICIQTDGHENSSTEHSWADLNALIKEKSALGWQFNFLGTGIDAYDTGERMGVSAMATMSSGRSSRHVRASYAAVADATVGFASRRARSTDLPMAARAASGDEHYQRVFGAGGSPPQQSPASGGGPAPRGRHKAVDDFTL
jgi:hypothetical protein